MEEADAQRGEGRRERVTWTVGNRDTDIEIDRVGTVGTEGSLLP